MTENSNLTLVRVRGKNHGNQSRVKPRSKAESHHRPRDRPRRKLQAVASGAENNTPRRLVLQNRSNVSLIMSSSEKTQSSCLERLPTELLQNIFLLSPNLSLPTTSPYLHRVLTSSHVRTKLTIAAFTSGSDAHGSREHRSALLRQKWMTFSFLRACQKAYMIQSTSKELMVSASIMPNSIKSEAISTIEENFTEYFSMGDRCVAFTRKFHHDLSKRESKNNRLKKQGDGSFTWTGSHGAMFKAYLLGEGSELNIFAFEGSQPEIREEDGLLHLPRSRSPNYSRVFRFPEYLNTCEIPEKLLHGPWTQEKGDYLKMLLDGGAAIDWINSTSGEVASKGLEDAIRENNLLAVIALVVGRPYIPFTEKANAETTMRESEYARELALKKGCDGKFYKTTQDNPQTPWLVRTGKPWKDIKSVGVVPTTKHMRLAITQVSKDVGPIISWMAMAWKIDIDPDDPEITKWAIHNMAEWNRMGQKPMRTRRRLDNERWSDEWYITGQFVLEEMDHIRERLLWKSRAHDEGTSSPTGEASQ